MTVKSSWEFKRESNINHTQNKIVNIKQSIWVVFSESGPWDDENIYTETFMAVS